MHVYTCVRSLHPWAHAQLQRDAQLPVLTVLPPARFARTKVSSGPNSLQVAAGAGKVANMVY